MNRALLVLSLVLILVSISGIAQAESKDAGLVIGVFGRTYIKRDASGQWNRIKTGESVRPDDIIKTHADSTVLIVHPNGSLTRIGENRERLYRKVLQTTAEPDRMSVFRILEEFAKVKNRRETAIVRSQNDPGIQWRRLLHKPVLNAENLDLILDLAVHFDRQKQFGQTDSTLALLLRSQPKHTGVVRLVAASQSGRPQNNVWRVWRTEGKERSIINPNSVVQSGDFLQFEYQADSESFAYLFMTTHSDNDNIDTDLIHPPPDTFNRSSNGIDDHKTVKAARKMLLPSRSRAYILDDIKGTEYLWGWSCHVRLHDLAGIENEIARIETKLRNGSILTEQDVPHSNPLICPSSVLQPYHHH